jgi:hypothetical protein
MQRVPLESRRRYPFGATVLGAIGAMLIVLEGIFFVADGPNITPAHIFGYGLAISAAGMGIIAIIEGCLALGLLLFVYAEPGGATLVGIGTISLALLSLFIGGGFLLGALLLWAGGVMAIFYGLEHRAPEALNGPADLFEDEEPARTTS